MFCSSFKYYTFGLNLYLTIRPMTNKRIIIIGATSGIGYQLAMEYIAKGWCIGIAGRKQEKLNELKELAPSNIFTKAIDINQPECQALLSELIAEIGGVDIYIHSSGVGTINKALDTTIELDTLQTNVLGFTRCLTTVCNHFHNTGKGHIVVISSIAGTKGIGLAPSYSASKRFQNIYIDALAQHSRSRGSHITFTDIRPGFVETPLLKSRSFPMQMDVSFVAKEIVKAIDKRKRVSIIDLRYAAIVMIWRMIPRWIWERIRLT